MATNITKIKTFRYYMCPGKSTHHPLRSILAENNNKSKQASRSNYKFIENTGGHRTY